MTLLRRLLLLLVRLVKWLLAAVLLVEFASFLIISGSNYLIYGHLREGSRVAYDPYTLFLQPQRPTIGNSEDPAAAVVWMFGGSTMRGATPDDALTIPSLVAARLNTDGRAVRVVNFGMDSYNSLLETKYLEKALIEAGRAPDLIVFYDGANDAKYFIEHRHADAHHGYRRVSALIESYYKSWFGLLKPLNAALQASFTREVYDRLHQAVLPLDPADPILAEMAEKTAARYAFVDRLATALGAKFLLVWQPMAWTEPCIADAAVTAAERGDLPTGGLKTMRGNFRTASRALATREAGKSYFVDLGDALCARTQALYRPDGVHLTDAGRRTLAARLAPLVAERLGENR